MYALSCIGKSTKDIMVNLECTFKLDSHIRHYWFTEGFKGEVLMVGAIKYWASTFRPGPVSGYRV